MDLEEIKSLPLPSTHEINNNNNKKITTNKIAKPGVVE